MARITTIDCERIIASRFELVLLAAPRARALSRGHTPHVSLGGLSRPLLRFARLPPEQSPTWLRQRLSNLQRADVEDENGL